MTRLEAAAEVLYEARQASFKADAALAAAQRGYAREAKAAGMEGADALMALFGGGE